MENLEKTTMRKVYWRIVPFLFLAMLLNYVDRINLGYAALRMNEDLTFAPAVFGFGASIFFAGYILFELPSNLMLHRFGARIWIGRILVSWGVISSCMALVSSEWSFYTVRFLLGAAEAGFLPGAALYLTYWFPPTHRAQAAAGYLVAGAAAAVFAGPLSTMVMSSMDGLRGLPGWQWMFVLEGIPTILLGLFCFAWLTDRPEGANWLTSAQRIWLTARLSDETAAIPDHGKQHVVAVLKDSRVWRLAAMFGCSLVGTYSIFFWMPTIIKNLGQLSDVQTGFASALPFLMAIAMMVVVGRTSDAAGDRKVHLVALYAVSAASMGVCAFSGSLVVSYVSLCIVVMCSGASAPLFWSSGSAWMSGPACAAALGAIGAISNVGGLVGPWLIGVMRGRTGDFSTGIAFLALFFVAAMLLAMSLPSKLRRRESRSDAGSIRSSPTKHLAGQR